MGYKGQHQLGMFYINQNCALRGRGEMRTLRTSSPAVKEGKKGKKELLEAVFPFTPALVCMPLPWWDGSSDAALPPWVPWFVSSFLQLLQVCWKLPHQKNNCGFRGHSINGTGVGEMDISKTTLTQICVQRSTESFRLEKSSKIIQSKHYLALPDPPLSRVPKHPH